MAVLSAQILEAAGKRPEGFLLAAKQFLALGVRRENLIAVDVKVGGCVCCCCVYCVCCCMCFCVRVCVLHVSFWGGCLLCCESASCQQL